MKRTRWSKQVLFLTAAMLLLSACAVPGLKSDSSNQAPQQIAGLTPEKPTQTEVRQIDQIIFLTMSIRQESGLGARTLEIQELVKSPGTLKKSAASHLPTTPYLSCILFSDNRRIDSIQLEHPLFKQIEYVNEKNQLSRKDVKLDQSEFFIRFQQGSASSLTIEERLPGTLPKALITIKL